VEPIFEADFEDCSYGFRPERNAHQALEKIRENLRAGKCEIYDADLEGYFDQIPHDKLMACVRMRVIDGSVLKLIRQWLEAPVVEEDQAGRRRLDATGAVPLKEGCSHRCWPISICTGLIVSSKVRADQPIGPKQP
jgi:hypothetical protein